MEDPYRSCKADTCPVGPAQAELAAAGIAVMKGGVATTTMKEALRAHANGDDKVGHRGPKEMARREVGQRLHHLFGSAHCRLFMP